VHELALAMPYVPIEQFVHADAWPSEKAPAWQAEQE